jgi:hypothetical protein
VSERVPPARASLRCCAARIALEEPTNGGIVAEYRRGMNAAARDLGMRSKDRLGTLERARGVSGVERDARGVDEGGQRIV